MRRMIVLVAVLFVVAGYGLSDAAVEGDAACPAEDGRAFEFEPPVVTAPATDRPTPTAPAAQTSVE